MGASHTYRLENKEQLQAFLAERNPEAPYIMEEFIYATVNSYDAIIQPVDSAVFEGEKGHRPVDLVVVLQAAHLVVLGKAVLQVLDWPWWYKQTEYFLPYLLD